VAKKWPEVQKDFIGWVEESRGRLRLGNVRLFELDEDISIATLVSQHGYGNSPRPRIRYNALQICLQTLAEIAQRYEASIHLPKIGSGQAGGNWSIISEMIDTELVSKGHQVTVYQLESEKQSKNSQQSLLFSRQSNK
jgi:hypothetical protein